MLSHVSHISHLLSLSHSPFVGRRMPCPHTALMLNNVPKDDPTCTTRQRLRTLVICPVATINQWHSEISKFSKYGLISLSIYFNLYFFLSIFVSICLSLYISLCLSVSFCLCLCLSVCLSLSLTPMYIHSHARLPLDVEIHHGPNRSSDPHWLAEKDVVISGYKTGPRSSS